MSKTLTCPTAEMLVHLLQGRLPDEESEVLEQHLLSCEDCQRQTRELSQADTVAELLRKKADQSVGEVDNPLLNDVIERLQNRSLVATQISAIEGTQISGAAEGNEAEADLAQFIPALRPPETADELGRLGGFRLLKLLGHGGMGAVFLAEDVRLKRRVALKVLRPEFAKKKDAAERFLREAQAAATVRHDNVVTIFQVGEDNGTPFMAQELLHGESLHDRLHREKTLPIDEVLNIGRQIADGLAAAHAHGLLHRDVKPANVWLERSPVAPRQESRGETEVVAPSSIAGATDAARGIGSPVAERQGIARVKILDFGLARLEQADVQLTNSGMILGTPAYMSPEQADGHEVDARTDLFSLGVVLYRMTTGRLPFDGRSVTAILKALATVTPPQVKSVRSDVPAGLSDLIEQLLSKDRDARPVSASEVVRRMAALGRPVLETNDVRTAGRRRAGVLQVVLGLAACVLFGVIVIKLKDKDGKETKITLDVPPGTKVVSVEQSPDDANGSRTRESSDRSLTTSATKPPANDNARPFITLDKLDPQQIPMAERVAGQPDELVAVIGEQRLRHWSGMRSIAFHPTGEFFVTRCDRSDVRQLQIWSTKILESLSGATDREVWTKFQNGSAPLPCFSPNGDSLWSGTTSATIDLDANGAPLLRPSGGRPQHKLESYLPTVISPDSRWLAVTGSPAGILEIWDISKPTPKLAKEVSFPAQNFSNVLMLSRDGRRLMTDSTGANPKPESRLFLWDVDWSAEGGPAVTPFSEPIAATHGALSADGQRLVARRPGEPVRVLDLTQSPPRVEFETKDWEPFAFSPDGNWLATNQSSSVKLYQRTAETWTQRFRLAPAQANLQTMTFSPDGQTLVVGDPSGCVHVWDVSADPPVERLPAPPASRVTRLAFSPDGRRLAVQGWDGGTVWNVEGQTPKRLEFVEPTGQPGIVPSFSPDSRLVAFCGAIWNLGTDPPTTCFQQYRAQQRFSPFGNTIVSVRGTNHLLFEEWTATDKGAFRTTRGIRHWKPERPNTKADACHGLSTLQFSCQRTVLDDTQGNIEVWSLDDDQKPLVSVKYSNNLLGYRLSPDCNLLFVWGSGTGAVWNLKTDPPTETRFRLTDLYTRDAYFTLDHQQIVTADDKGVVLYDWKRQREHRRLTFPGRVVSLALHPDGQHVATANGNGTVYILRLSELSVSSQSQPAK